MNEVLELSYTGDILAHRRCRRSWAYEKYAGFHPYEQVQAMEGRLVHHAMEWMTTKYKESREFPSMDELTVQLQRRFRILWARGIKTAFTSRDATIQRVMGNIFPQDRIHPTVRAAIKGSEHVEYELRAVRKLVRGEFLGKSKLLLTGILDLVIQQESGFTYGRVWEWSDRDTLVGNVVTKDVAASAGDFEIWDYKATRAGTPFMEDYVLQLLTYASLYKERTGRLPVRCVLFFVNEPIRARQLLAIEIDEEIVARAERWTIDQARELRRTARQFERDPESIDGGYLMLRDSPLGQRMDEELKKQCTACGRRYNCGEYGGYLGRPDHPDLSDTNVRKN